MSLDLLCIHPGNTPAIYQDLALDLTAIEPPLWCRLIAGYCRDRGHSVAILDAEAEGIGPDRIAAKVAVLAPRVVCMVVYGHQPSASTQQMQAAGETCRRIKRMLPDQPIIIVGGHVAALPERTLREEAVYFACNSEGPITVERLLAGVHRSEVPGLVHSGRHSVILVNPAPPLLDLAELHGHAWDLLPMDKYRAHNWQCLDGSPRQPYASIYTSLSCPFSCSFCMIDAPFRAAKARQYRMRDPVEVVAEIRLLHDKYGVKTIKITDEMFVLNRRHMAGICERLMVEPYVDELNIWAYARIDTVKAEHLTMLRGAGIRWLALGIESGSAHVRDGADKAFDEREIFATVRMIQAAGINVIGNFIFGLPDDTRETMRATLDLAKDLNCEFANFYSAMAYPGSRLFDEADPSTLPRSWSGYSQHSEDTRPLPTATLTSAEVLKFRDDAFLEYFTSRRYLEMVSRQFGEKALREIETMTAKPMRRKLLEFA